MIEIFNRSIITEENITNLSERIQKNIDNVKITLTFIESIEGYYQTENNNCSEYSIKVDVNEIDSMEFAVENFSYDNGKKIYTEEKKLFKGEVLIRDKCEINPKSFILLLEKFYENDDFDDKSWDNFSQNYLSSYANEESGLLEGFGVQGYKGSDYNIFIIDKQIEEEFPLEGRGTNLVTTYCIEESNDLSWEFEITESVKIRFNPKLYKTEEYKIKCSKCDFEKNLIDYTNIGILPKEFEQTLNGHKSFEISPKDGGYKSKISENYCENCENSTMWFMGKVDEIDRLRYSLIMNKMKIGNLTQDLENNSKIIERYSKGNLLIKLVYAGKLRNEKTRRIILSSGINKLKESEKELLEEIESVKQFFNNSKPKCFECDNNNLQQKPKHICGGDILIINPRGQKQIPYNEWQENDGYRGYWKGYSKITEYWFYDKYGGRYKMKLEDLMIKFNIEGALNRFRNLSKILPEKYYME